MNPLSTSPPPATETEETVEQTFRRLEAQWIAEVGLHSSTTRLTNHPAWKAILALGPAVVPYMLRDLEERPRLWVWALPTLTGANPVPDEEEGYIAKMSERWLNWARFNGVKW